MRRLILMSTALAAITSSAIAADSGAIAAVDLAERALQKGHGAMCSLAMTPSTVDPYYPCIDIGSYRYVREYQKVSAYVVRPDEKPFKIMAGTASAPYFVVGGPWETNMAQQAVQFWNDVVEGGKAKAEEASTASKARQDAEAFIRKTMAPEQPPPKDKIKPAQTQETLTTEQLRAGHRATSGSLAIDQSDIKRIMSQDQ